MTISRREITADDILSVESYSSVRNERRAAVTSIKQHRRVQVGPFVCFYFESFDTMLHQVHEMLYAERGGEQQLADELAAYNPLIPKGRELVATMMIEIDDQARRDRELFRLGYIDTTVKLTFSGHEIIGEPEQDQNRTDESGRVSTVHFLRFTFTDLQISDFQRENSEVVLSIGHLHYPHMVRLTRQVCDELARDFD